MSRAGQKGLAPKANLDTIGLMKKLKNLDEAVSYVLGLTSGDLKMATPLGLGKANQLINGIYDHFKNSSGSRRLEIYTALSLDTPAYASSLEKKLLEPFIQRHYGNYPKLKYVEDQRQNKMPEHIQVHEFYFQAAQALGVAKAQQNYISLNYTHAARGLADRGLEVIVQIIARSPKADDATYSLSCNPDMTLDLADMYVRRGRKLFVIGVVHPDLPFLGGDAVVNAEFFDAVLDSGEVNHTLFSLPRNPVDEVDHLIGLHASQLVEDGGTLQMGIGSLSDALVHSLLQRHQTNKLYQLAVDQFWSTRRRPADLMLYQLPFRRGLYGTSEMLMDGFMHLRRAQILKRVIFDQDENKRRYLHAAFVLGSKELYRWLRGLQGEDYEGLSMTRVSKVNDLYDAHEMALRRQRKKARFFNTCMQVDLLGGAVSDTLESGQVISGVGGQYNFVSMSQELEDSHSVLMLRSVRKKNGKRISNMIVGGGQLTVPRHLRDVVVTEYGVAYLKGRTDAEVITALIEISDSQFQPDLVRWAKKNKKISNAYVVPEAARHNTSDQIKNFMAGFKEHNLFPLAPFGLDFEPVELRLIQALSALKEKSKWQLFGLFCRGFFTSSKNFKDEMDRMQLSKPTSFAERLERLVVASSLAALDRDHQNARPKHSY